VDEHIEIELAPESEADQAGELKGRYVLERDRERISEGDQILFGEVQD
jgi:hypothetical protein